MKRKDDLETTDTKQRLQQILQGAFSGPATPLKNIPKKDGESRATRAGGASDATAKTVQPRT